MSKNSQDPNDDDYLLSVANKSSTWADELLCCDMNVLQSVDIDKIIKEHEAKKSMQPVLNSLSQARNTNSSHKSPSDDLTGTSSRKYSIANSSPIVISSDSEQNTSSNLNSINPDVDELLTIEEFLDILSQNEFA